MEDVLQLNEFFVEGNSPNKSHVLLNITEPSTAVEKAKGYFFAICEIDNADNKYIIKLQSIIDEIENNYYEIADQTDKNSLEIVLDKINSQSFSLLKPQINLNCVIGAIRNTDIIFSFYGQPLILLLYKNKQGQYKKIDLVAQNITEEENEQTLFSQIIQGKISLNDYFFAGTSRVIDYFSQDRLQKIISTRPPRQSAEHLQRVLAELRSELSFGGLIIHLQSLSHKLMAKERSGKKGDSAKSLTGFFTAQENTANILSPSLLPNLKKITDNLRRKKTNQETELANYEERQTQIGAEINSAHLRSRPTTPETKSLISSINWQSTLKIIFNFCWQALKYLGQAIAWLAMLIFTLISKLGKSAILLFMVAVNYRNRRRDILNDWSRALKNHKQNIKQIPISIKILIGLSLVMVIILIISIVYLRAKQTRDQANKFFASTRQEIKNKKDTAESSLIYNDLPAALADLKSADALFSKLDCQDKTKQATCQELKQDLEILLNKVRRMVIVKPEELANWSQINPQIKNSQLLMIDKKIIGFNQAGSEVTTYDLLSKTSQATQTNISTQGFTAAAVPKENDYAILVYENNKLANYDPKNNTWKKIDISYPNQNAQINNLFVYSRRLYCLDKQNNQIYKHDVTKTGFAQGEEWLKDDSNLDLSNGVGLAIDGEIFTLTSQGKLNKFKAGQKQDFTIQGLDPNLTSADALWTYYELKYLYILDASNKRLIILDKQDGSLKKQLTAKEFVKPTSMVVDEANDTAYILDNNKLYKIDLELK